MLTRKIWNFIVQLLLTPISLLSNILAVAPIMMFAQGGLEGIMEIFSANISMIIMLPIMIFIFCLGFVINRALFKLKGKKTDEDYIGTDTADILTDLDYDENENTLTTYYTTVTYPAYKNRLSAMGWLATFLTFIAFPLRIISLLMAFLAIFIPYIYVTHRQLNPNMPVCKGAIFTHCIFDFVILPMKKSVTNKSPMCILFIFIYIIATAVYMFITAIFFELFSIPDLFLLAILFLLLCELVLLIKYCVVIVHDYNLKKALLCLLKLSTIPAIIILSIVILSLLGLK